MEGVLYLGRASSEGMGVYLGSLQALQTLSLPLIVLNCAVYFCHILASDHASQLLQQTCEIASL